MSQVSYIAKLSEAGAPLAVKWKQRDASKEGVEAATKTHLGCLLRIYQARFDTSFSTVALAAAAPRCARNLEETPKAFRMINSVIHRSNLHPVFPVFGGLGPSKQPWGRGYRMGVGIYLGGSPPKVY